MQVTAFLDLVQTKSNETYFKFIKYLEEDYDWLAWTLNNTQITSEEILSYNQSLSQPQGREERERERERMMREVRRRQEEMERVRDQFRERESLTSPTSSLGSLNSPLHSSDFSLSSTKSSVSEDRLETLSEVSSLQSRDLNLQAEISEQMINFVKKNSIILRRWQSLAHSAGLSHRVEIIKARVRAEGGDLDQHVTELIREWVEEFPESANLGGLINLLREQNFNDTALKLENGTYCKKR